MVHRQSPAWLLLVHQLPARPTNLRVKTWRRLQDLGAIALKHSVYVLPHSDQHREDFEWMKSEIEAMGGEAAVFTADSIDSLSNDDVIAAFRLAREGDYAVLARQAAALGAATRTRGRGTLSRSRWARRVRQLRDRLGQLDAVAFFRPANREAAAAAVARLEGPATGTSAASSPASEKLTLAAFRKRVWITRPRPGIDRLASAWLIRRFIDPHARFTFAETPPRGSQAIPFDMYGVEFGHSRDGCTFETLVARFGLATPPISRIAHLVHDLDLKVSRYGSPEAPAFGLLVDGLRQMHTSDAELLEHGIALFEALHRAFTGTGASAAARTRRHRRTSSRQE